MPLTEEERRKIYEEEKARLEAREKLQSEKKSGCFLSVVFIVLVLLAIIIVVPYQRGKKERKIDPPQVDFTIAKEEDLRIFKKVDMGQFSLYMELLMDAPTKTRIETVIGSLLKQYGSRDRLQIDIFDDLEALQKRGNENYPSALVYKHWLVSITKDEVYRFYLKERLDIE